MRARDAKKLKQGDVIFNRCTNMFVKVEEVELCTHLLPETVFIIHTIDILNRKEKWTHIYLEIPDKEDMEWYLNRIKEEL